MDNNTILDELREQRERLANEDLTGKTLGEVRDDMRRLQSLERQIEELEQQSIPCQTIPQNSGYIQIAPTEEHQPLFTRSIFQQPQTFRYDTTQHGRPSQHTPTQSRISEANLGRYVMTILASTLCLLALAVFAVSFWPYLPDIVKFIGLLVLGGGLEALGFWWAQNGSLRPFWLGIAGVGAGCTFITIVCGCLVWLLYGVGFAGIALIGWFGAHYFLAQEQKATLFYMIAYIGGIIAVALACLSAPTDISGELMIAAIIAAIVVIGQVGSYRTKSWHLVTLNMLFCWVSASSIEKYLGYLRAEVYPDLTTAFGFEHVFYVLPAIAFLMAVLCLFDVRRLPQKESTVSAASTIILTLINSAFVVSCAMNVDYINKAVMCILACAVIVLCGLKGKEHYYLGAAFPFILALGMASDYISGLADPELYRGHAALLPAIALVSSLVVAKWLGNKTYRISFIIAFTTTLAMAFAEPSTGVELFHITTCVVLLVTVSVYFVWAQVHGYYFKKPIDLFVLAMLPGLLVTMAKCLPYYPSVLPTAVLLICLEVYGAFYLAKEENSGEGYMWVPWYVVRFVAYVSMIAQVSVGSGDLEQLVLLNKICKNFN